VQLLLQRLFQFQTPLLLPYFKECQKLYSGVAGNTWFRNFKLFSGANWDSDLRSCDEERVHNIPIHNYAKT